MYNTYYAKKTINEYHMSQRLDFVFNFFFSKKNYPQFDRSEPHGNVCRSVQTFISFFLCFYLMPVDLKRI